MPMFTQTEATNVINAVLGKQTYPAPTGPIMARLTTNTPTAATAGTAPANAGGSAYAPQSATAAFASSSASNGQISTSAAITYTNMPAATIVGIELWDSATTPRRLLYGTLTASKTTALGDSLTIASGQLTAALS